MLPRRFSPTGLFVLGLNGDGETRGGEPQGEVGGKKGSTFAVAIAAPREAAGQRE